MEGNAYTEVRKGGRVHKCQGEPSMPVYAASFVDKRGMGRQTGIVRVVHVLHVNVGKGGYKGIAWAVEITFL